VADFEPNDVRVGLCCMAPVKRPSASKRMLEEVEVVWASAPGPARVVEVLTFGRKRFRSSFAVSVLRKLGAKGPELGVFV